MSTINTEYTQVRSEIATLDKSFKTPTFMKEMERTAHSAMQLIGDTSIKGVHHSVAAFALLDTLKRADNGEDVSADIFAIAKKDIKGTHGKLAFAAYNVMQETLSANDSQDPQYGSKALEKGLVPQDLQATVIKKTLSVIGGSATTMYTSEQAVQQSLIDTVKQKAIAILSDEDMQVNLLTAVTVAFAMCMFQVFSEPKDKPQDGTLFLN
jgi:hypothetical protein